MEEMAVGYLASNTNIPVPLFDLGWEGPAGQMFSTTNDLAKLMGFFFQADVRTGYDSIKDNSKDQFNSLGLKPSTARELLLPIYINDDGKSGFGFPWEMTLTDNHWTLAKDGNVLGFSAEFIMIPSIKLGTITLINSDAGNPSLIGYEALEFILPAFEALLFQYQHPSVLPSNVNDYCGSYYLEYPFPTTGIVVLINDTQNHQHLHITLTVSFSDMDINILESDISWDSDLEIFRLSENLSQTCMSFEGGGSQIVNFYRNSEEDVVSFDINGLFYGMFIKQQGTMQ